MDNDTRFLLQPILAENVNIAKLILVQLLRKVPEGRKITFKVPKENLEGVELMKRIGLDITDCDIATVMFTKRQIAVPVSKVFSLMNGMNQPA